MRASFAVGPVTFHLYGLVLGVAIAVGYEIARRVGRRHGLAVREVEGVFWWAVLGGLVGARLYHVIDYWSYYRLHVSEMVMVWKGGLAIWGAVMGGILGISLYILFKYQFSNFKKTLWRYLDVGVMGLPVAQAIGRFGNFFNQELYGLETTLPWGIMISNQIPVTSNQQIAKYHPLFAYEAILLGILAYGLWLIEKQKRLPFGKGAYFGVYGIGYGLIRFGLEYLRIDPWRLGVLTVAQWVALGFGLLGVWHITNVRAHRG